MYIDLHTHSIASDDSKASVEQFAQWTTVLKKKGFNIDGFVLTEHRQFNIDIDYSELSNKYNILILKGAELDTDCGHVLIYGVTEKLMDLVDFTDLNLNAEYLIETCKNNAAIAIPAHPGREGIGLIEYTNQHPRLFENISIVEGLNASNRPNEKIRTTNISDKYGYLNTGGSDAHIVSAIGSCLTYFKESITSELELVQALKKGNFKAVTIEETIFS
jgi:predicted metal-dependent phosphoesterase TrpH|tara:strand:+ start:1210 stop:1863 length:654 start_codon:yes stop_codon:yes gene_type:complete